MKLQTVSTWILAFPLALAAGCGGSSTEAGASDGAVSPAAGATDDDFVVTDEVVTPAEADAEAEAAITEENLDEELEKLEQSIDG